RGTPRDGGYSHTLRWYSCSASRMRVQRQRNWLVPVTARLCRFTKAKPPGKSALTDVRAFLRRFSASKPHPFQSGTQSLRTFFQSGAFLRAEFRLQHRDDALSADDAG